MGLHVMDWIVLLAYLLGTTVLGLVVAKKVHSIADYFMPRRYGKAFTLFHAFGTGSHSDQAVSVAAKSYTNGISGIWYQWLWLFTSPFYWLIAPIFRRFRALTTADVFALRFDRGVAGLFAFVGTIGLMTNIGLMLKGSGAVIAAVIGDHATTELFVLPGEHPFTGEDLVIVIMTVLFVVYGVAGGMGAAVVTDFIQGILTIVFSFMLLPFVFDAVGGMEGMRETIGDAHMFSLVAPGDITVFYVAIIAMNALIGVPGIPSFMGNVGVSKCEFDSRFGQMGGSIVKRICTMAWALTGLAAVAYYAGTEVDPDKVYGHMASEFFPQIMPGLLGVFIAALLASVMSSCDSFMIGAAALFTENAYRPLRPNQSRQHYMWVARISTLFIVAGGIVYAYWLESVVHGLEIFWKINPLLGLAFWLGLFWRRTTVAGAWATCIGTVLVWWLTAQTFVVDQVAALPFADRLHMIAGEGADLKMNLPWQMIFYLTSGAVCGIAVSLMTKPVSEEKLEQFYALARTPVNEGEVIDEPCTLPAGMTPAPRNNLVSAGGLEIPKPMRVSVIGFIVGWIAVGVLIGGFYAFINFAP